MKGKKEGSNYNPRFIDLSGQKFNHLTVLNVNRTNHRGYIVWNCKCDCGNECTATSYSITTNKKTSCGCIRRKYRTEFGGANRLGWGESALNSLYCSYRKSAKDRGFNFELDKDTFRAITSSNCFYCGIEPNIEKVTQYGVGSYKYNGVDRIDSNLDYTVDNVVPCCFICNRAKSNMKQEDFLNWINRSFMYQDEIKKALQ